MTDAEEKDQPKPSGAGGMIRESWFPTHVYVGQVDECARLNEKLASCIRQRRSERPAGLQRSNVTRAGAWHSETDLHQQPQFALLTTAILVQMGHVFDDQGYDSDYEPAIDLMWANISPRHAFNRSHSHPGVLWSGVYYVKSPANCGRIMFADPRAQARVIEPSYPSGASDNRDTWSEVFYEPREGRLLIFPAWLCHEVEPNMAEGTGEDSERISISFNVFQRQKGRPTEPGQGPIVMADLQRLWTKG